MKNDYTVCLVITNGGSEFSKEHGGGTKRYSIRRLGTVSNITFTDGVFYEVSGFFQI
jgi:hypothetical protein